MPDMEKGQRSSDDHWRFCSDDDCDRPVRYVQRLPEGDRYWCTWHAFPFGISSFDPPAEAIR